MTCLWVLYARKPRWSVLQFCEELCMHWQLDLDWVCCLPQVCTIFVLSETLKFGRSHITCQDVRHASWGSSECDLCRKCESSVKVCVTHLRMNKREFVLGMAWNGWVVTCMVSRWIVKLNCRLCPSCIWAPAYPSECIRPCLGDSNDSWQRTCQLQQPRQFQRQRENFPCLRIQRWRHRQELLRRNQRKRESRTLLMCMEKTRKTKRKEMLEEMTIDRDLQGWECMNHLIPMMRQTCWTLPRGLAVGITSMVAALKGSTDKIETLIKSTHTVQQDLCRSLEAVGAAVNNMARASESLAAGVNHNTSRVGAVVGEYNKLKKHLEWALDVSMADVLKRNNKGRTERDQALQDLMTQLFESMDKLQENMKLVAERIDKGTPPEAAPAYDPPQPPTGHHGMKQSSPPLAPMTPATGVSLGPSHLPPPPAVPPRPVVPSPPTLPVAKFVGYSPAKMGELPMSYPLALEVKDIKSPPCQVIEEVRGRIRCVSPTARHDPMTGTAAFSPLGYIQIQGTQEYRRVYPWCSYLSRVPKALEFVWSGSKRIVDFVNSRFTCCFQKGRYGWAQVPSLSLKGGRDTLIDAVEHNFVYMLFC